VHDLAHPLHWVPPASIDLVVAALALHHVTESLSPRHDWPVRAWRLPLTALCEEFHDAGFLIERLVEPRPAPEMAQRYPDDYARLEREPGFIAFRLTPAPTVSP
jgi:hypothetical protein